SLDQDELQTALAHEIGHVQLGHFSSREARRQVGPKIPDRGAPVESDSGQGLGQSRAYDRQEELAADRYAVELLDKLPGSPGGSSGSARASAWWSCCRTGPRSSEATAASCARAASSWR